MGRLIGSGGGKKTKKGRERRRVRRGRGREGKKREREREKEKEREKATELRPFCCAEITPWGLCESSFPTHLPASGLMLRRRFALYLLSDF